MLKTVNWHLYPICNYRCTFCYQTYANDKDWMCDPEQAERLIMNIVDGGADRITFSGGEPLLHPFLPRLIRFAKELGLVVGVVTNGSKLTKQWLDSCDGGLDIVAISIDSPSRPLRNARFLLIVLPGAS